MNKKLFFFISIVLGLISAQTFAQRGPGAQGGARGGDFNFFSAMPFLQALDEDGDGELSSDEIENAALALRTLDKNKDGKLSEDEVRPAGGRPGAARGAQGGGRPAVRGEGGGRPDFAQGRQRGGGGQGGGRPAGGTGRPRNPNISVEAPESSEVKVRVDRLMALDRNEDGKLAEDEIGAALIEKADKDEDGFASEDEIRAIVIEEDKVP